MAIIFTRKEDDVVTTIADTVEQKEDGLHVHEGAVEFVMGCMDVMNMYEGVIVPDKVTVLKYLYTSTDGFVLNPNYEEFLTVEQKLELLQEKYLLMSTALEEVIMGGM